VCQDAQRDGATSVLYNRQLLPVSVSQDAPCNGATSLQIISRLSPVGLDAPFNGATSLLLLTGCVTGTTCISCSIAGSLRGCRGDRCSFSFELRMNGSAAPPAILSAPYNKAGLVGRFLPEGGKNVFFHGKNRTGKNTYCRQK